MDRLKKQIEIHSIISNIFTNCIESENLDNSLISNIENGLKKIEMLDSDSDENCEQIKKKLTSALTLLEVMDEIDKISV